MNSGERIEIPFASKRLREEHFARYNFCFDYIEGKKVLDIACGSGYGSDLLAQNGASYVIGADVAEKVINQNKELYDRENLRFEFADAENLPFEDNFFDVVVSFETIEHLHEPENFLQGAKRVLKDNGLLIISTPNKKITSPFTKKPQNKFHIKEYKADDLHHIISKYFEMIYMGGQRQIPRYYANILVRYFFRVLFRFLRIFDVNGTRIYSTKYPANVVKNNNSTEPRIFVVVAANKYGTLS